MMNKFIYVKFYNGILIAAFKYISFLLPLIVFTVS